MYDPKFEWALSGPNCRVIACTMQLPTLSELQELAANCELTDQDLMSVYTAIAKDWQRGAVSTYFVRELNAGRLFKQTKDVHTEADSHSIASWTECSSRTHKLFTKHTNTVNTQRVQQHIAQVIRQTVDADPSRPNAPVRPDAPLVTSAAVGN